MHGMKSLKIMFVFSIPQQRLSETFFNLRRTERDMITGLHVKCRYSCQILMKLEFSRQLLEKMLKYDIL